MVSKAEKRAARIAAAAASTKQGETQAPPSTPKADDATPKTKVVTKVVGNLKVLKTDASLRGAREAWYEVLKEHDGKPAQEYLDNTTKKPPSLPKSGKQEPSSGWLRWFVRHGFAAIVVEKTA